MAPSMDAASLVADHARNGARRPATILPAELMLRILSSSAEASTTRHARNVCLVCRLAYRACWPSLYRIVALRSARQLKAFSEFIYPPRQDAFTAGLVVDARKDNTQSTRASAPRRLERAQNAVKFLYVNNNKDGDGLRAMQTDEKPEMWMISILLAASNLQVIHFEEYWSVTYPWEAPEEKPLIAYPLMLLSRFTAAVHAAFIGSPNASWVKRVLQIGGQDSIAPSITYTGTQAEDAPTTDIYDAIVALERAESLRHSPPRLLAQPCEVTLSALAVTRAHLLVGGTNDVTSKTRELPANEQAFVRLQRMHLYFAKLSPYFCEALMSLPALTHLRLTRPFADSIIESVVTILERGYTSSNPYEVLSRPAGAAAGLPALRTLIIETGVYMDGGTIRALRDLETSEIGRGRLYVVTASDAASRRRREEMATTTQESLLASSFDEALSRAVSTDVRIQPRPAVETIDEAAEGDAQVSTPTSSSSRAVNYVTSSEQRGFEDFVRRAHGHCGIWRVANDSAG